MSICSKKNQFCAAAAFVLAAGALIGPLGGAASALSRDDYEWSEISEYLDESGGVKMSNSFSFNSGYESIFITPDGKTLLAQGGRSQYNQDLYSSVDDGKTWTKISGFASGVIFSASYDGSQLFMRDDSDGVYFDYSQNGGRTWTELTSPDASSLSYGPSYGDTVIPGSDGTLYFSSLFYRDGKSVIWASQDGGASWNLVYNGDSMRYIVKENTVVILTNSGTWLSSKDRGATWEQTGIVDSLDTVPWHNWDADGSGKKIIMSRMNVDENTGERHYSVSLSQDGGNSWNEILSDVDATFEDIYISPDGQFINLSYRHTKSGVQKYGTFQSYDGGATWTEIAGKMIHATTSVQSNKILETHRELDGDGQKVTHFIGTLKQTPETPTTGGTENTDNPSPNNPTISSGDSQSGDEDAATGDLAQTGSSWVMLFATGLLVALGGAAILRRRTAK